MELFLLELCENHCIIKCFIGDGPKRSNARECLGHNSYHPCEYCFSKGCLFHVSDKNAETIKEQLLKQRATILNQIENFEEDDDENPETIQTFRDIIKNIDSALKDISTKKRHIVWPSHTMNGRLRTRGEIMEIVEKIENDVEPVSRDEAKGIVRRSLFLDIPYFNFTRDFPAEYLHSVCLGVGKRMIILTFNVSSDKRQKRITNRKLSSCIDFNTAMIGVKSVREFGRRVRPLDLSVMKGQEYRNIILFYFVIVVDCIEVNAKERRLWLLFSFMVRACVLPTEEFREFDHELVSYCSRNFYALYEKLFGENNCTYYTHIVGSHMLEIRDHGPLTFTSAFPFESFYGEMRNAFQAGTTSTLKQIFTNILLKRTLGKHCCEADIFFSSHETPLECNNLVYTFVQKQYQFFKIINVHENSLECHPVGKFEKHFPETPKLQWKDVGVFKAGGVGIEKFTIPKAAVAGKVIRVKNLFITCPNNVLREK